MNHYEVMYVVDTGIDDKSRQDLITRFSDLVAANGGEVDRVDEWGKRRLAYPINYKTEGYYVLMYITAPPTLPKELERNLQISDSILRYLVIRFDGNIPPKREPLRPASHPVEKPVQATVQPAQAP
ncbi:MAG: 30S ribosomal protein S6, partial [Clostridia bacterium]|nr:30S ribosomal protein S6 [Clostridia bacterium]